MKHSVNGPLHGLRIVDMTAVISGPYATQMLGDMGAEVIKIEPPDGDGQRMIGPARTSGMGPIFINSNRSKRAIALDLKTPAGRKVLLQLVETADVFTYNFRPSAMARLGLSHETLAAINPRLIYAGLFGFGQQGPYASRPAYDDLIQGGSTLSAMLARKHDGAPQYIPIAIADRVTGLNIALAILAAVVERHKSGLGQCIEIPMFETMVSFVLADHLGGLTFDPPLDEGGYARLLASGRKPYRTRDGYVSAMVFTDGQWRSLYRLLGREAQFDADPRLHSLTTRNEHIDALYGEIESIFAGETTAFWLETLRAADIPVMIVHDLQTIFEDPHLQAVGFFGQEDHPTEGALRTMRHPGTWSRTQPQATRHAPRHGEHSVEVLRELGYSEAEINTLIDQKAVIAQPGTAR